jgi:imidazolonepropionase-like amidohydrolase
MPRYHLNAVILPGGAEAQDLWIEDGRFVPGPLDGATALAPAGLWALPGLVDCHAHVGMDYAGKPEPTGSDALIASNLQDHLAAGTLLIRDPGSHEGSTIAWQGRAGFPKLQAAGRFLAPEGRYLPFGEWTAPGDLAAAARRWAGAGARWVKVVGDWPRYDKGLGTFVHIFNYDVSALAAAVEAAHAAGARVAVHVVGHEGTAIAIAASVDSIEHGEFLDADQLAACAARGIAWTPTVAMSEALAARMERTPEARARFARERDERAAGLLPVAERLGVTILAGTDIIPHGSIWREVAGLVRCGLSPRAALAAATTSARAFLGEPGIAAGAPADLVLYGANPLDDPEVLTAPALVILDGVVRGGTLARR